jgi:hypothetical protein
VQGADNTSVAANVFYIAFPQIAAHVEAVRVGGIHLAPRAGQQDLAAMGFLQGGGWGCRQSGAAGWPGAVARPLGGGRQRSPARPCLSGVGRPP